MKQGRAQRSMLQKTSLEVQRLGLHASTAGGMGSIPSQGTKIPQVMWCGQIVFRESPPGPVVRMWHFHCRGPGSIAGRGTKIPQARWYSKKNVLKAFKR